MQGIEYIEQGKIDATTQPKLGTLGVDAVTGRLPISTATSATGQDGVVPKDKHGLAVTLPVGRATGIIGHFLHIAGHGIIGIQGGVADWVYTKCDFKSTYGFGYLHDFGARIAPRADKPINTGVFGVGNLAANHRFTFAVV